MLFVHCRADEWITKEIRWKCTVRKRSRGSGRDHARTPKAMPDGSGHGAVRDADEKVREERC